MANEKRLIYADALAQKLKKHHDFYVEAWGGFKNLPPDTKARVDEISACWAEIYNEPTVDAVEVVHGEWIGIQYDGYADGCPVYDLWECSECREEYESEGDPPPYNYCPNCGAKMDGGVKNE